MKILLPKCPIDESEIEGLPFIYLAGPVRGGNDWQSHIALLLKGVFSSFYQIEDFVLAIPCRYPLNHRLQRFVITPSGKPMKHQTYWERQHMWARAVKRGCLLFWLPCEDARDPRDPNDGPYARDTYGELGELRGILRYEPDLSYVMGGDVKFPGLKQIALNFTEALGKEPAFYRNELQIAKAAIAKCSEE